MKALLVAEVVDDLKISATIEDWNTFLVRAKIPALCSKDRIAFLVGSGTYTGNNQHTRLVYCWFDPSSTLFKRIEFIGQPLKELMPKIESDVRVSEWEKLFRDSNLYTARRQSTSGGRYGRRTIYWLEAPIPEFESSRIYPLRFHYDRSGTKMYSISLRKD